MKRLFSILASLYLAAGTIFSQTAGMTPFGYGGNATGGGNATPTLVSNLTQLKNALSGTSSRVVIITQDITVSSVVSVSKAKNLTLMALPGKKLISNQQNQQSSGILYFSGGSNIILRNLTLVGPGAYDCDGWDLLCFDGVTNAWVDHCDFQDGVDGNFDNKGKTDNVTVSWCRFRYLKPAKAGGSGGSDDHRYSNLLGSGSSDKPSDGTYNFTWAYCWWDSGCRERMVRGRNASLHFLNCYWSSSAANYYIGPENMDAYIEGCYFGGSASLSKTFYQNYGGTNGAKFVNSYSTKGTLTNVSGRTVVTPSYAYTAMSYSEAKTAVTSTTCGAGATLIVGQDGSVSSACGGVIPPVTPTTNDTLLTASAPQTASTFWNFSDDSFSGMGDLTEATEVEHLLIAADASNVVSLEGNNKTCDNISFTRRLKTGGGLSLQGRYLTFGATGPCQLTFYCMSSSSSAARSMVIYADSLSNEVGRIENIGGSSLTAYSFQYTGQAANLYFGSESGGLNFYGIRLTYPSTPSGVVASIERSVSRKRIVNGQLVIERNGRLFNALGAEIR